MNLYRAVQASLFGKIGIFAFAAWAGAQNGGVIAGLSVCGIFLSVTAAAAGALRSAVTPACAQEQAVMRRQVWLIVLNRAGLMGDFRTGWITLTSPRSMFVAQVVGSLVSL